MRHISTILVCVFIMLQSGCRKGWLDVNYNPRQLTDNNATCDLVLPFVIISSPGPGGNPVLEKWMGYWCTPLAASGGADQTYNNLSHGLTEDGRPFDELYYLENKAMASNQTFYAGIAKILKALHWSRLVDVYNNTPYRDAFRPDIRQPRYDEGKFIYEEQMKQLQEGITLIKEAQVDKNIKITQADIMFHGNKTKWIRFANTIKLRLLVHQANRPDRATYIQTEIATIQAEGSGFLQTGEDAAFNPGYTELKANEYYASRSKHHIFPSFDGMSRTYTWESSSANTTAMNFLKANDDPRLGFFYSQPSFPVPPRGSEPFPQPAPQTYRGNRFGFPVSPFLFPFQSSNYVSQVGGVTAHGPVTNESSGILKGYDMDSWVITSIESMFLQAEAIQRGWLPGNAEEAYITAVKESFRWLNVGGNRMAPALSDAVFDTWYNAQVSAGNTNVSWVAAPDKYKLLMFQKYIAFNSIEPFEIYTDYRRNGRYPDIPLSYDPGRTSGTMPIRLPYPNDEYVVNRENVVAQGEINVFTSKIWWMP